MASQKSKAKPVTMILRGRLAFVHVFKPRPPPPGQEGGEPKYSVSIMIPKKDPQVKKIQEVIAHLANEEWGPGASKKLGTTYKTILRDGNDRANPGEGETAYPEFAGHVYLNASSKGRPGIVILEGGANREVISQEDIYSGVEAQVQVNFFTYSNVGKGVSAGLNNIQVLQEDGGVHRSGEGR